MRPTEKIMEYEPTITEWEGVRLRVILEFPNRQSITSQEILSKVMLEDVRYLTMPEYIKMEIENSRNMASSYMIVKEWEQKNNRAKKLVERIAHTVSWHLLKYLEKYYAAHLR